MKFLCPNCNRELEIPDEAAGSAGTCFHCGAGIVAPTADGQPARVTSLPGESGTPGGAVSNEPTGELVLGDIVNEALGIATRHWALLIGAALIAFFASAIVQNVPTEILKAIGAPEGLTVLVSVVLAIAMMPLQYGPWYVLDSLLVTGSADISLVFRGYTRAGDVILTTILQALAAVPVVVLAAILMPLFFAGASSGAGNGPGVILSIAVFGAAMLYVVVGVMFAPMEVVDKGAGPLDAIRESWRAVAGRRLPILGMMIVLGLIGIVGIVALCIGVLFTFQITFAGQMLIYRQLRGLRGADLPPA